jgi:hypothetical protein
MISEASNSATDRVAKGGPLSTSLAKADVSASGEPSFSGDHRLPVTSAPTMAEMAQHDLDAALQLLAERAQYITGASGAAIALRRGRCNDMLCRASAGASAPELGTLLSMEYGFTGESVRTGQTLFCNDAATDSRVNREGCKQLGIASVVAMPIMSEGQAVGVFELFSGKPSAFVERDFAALRRLSEMVETAVTHAAATQSVTIPDNADATAADRHETLEIASAASPESSLSEIEAEDTPVPPSSSVAANTNSIAPKKTEPERNVPKPLYWSVAMQVESGRAPAPETSEAIPVPAVLRDLKKCQACGFPVSHGRTLCVECEEKQWKGLAVKSTSGQATGESRKEVAQSNERRISATARPPAAKIGPSRGRTTPVTAPSNQPPVAEIVAPIPAAADLQNSDRKNSDRIDSSELFLTAASQSESWLAANKFILAALLLVAIIIAAIAWLR